MMNERYSRYRSTRGCSPAGCRVRPRYVKDRSTVPAKLRQVGEMDQYAIIQSFKDSCDVARLVERATSGDPTVLQRVQGLYFDASGLPSHMTDIMALGEFASTAWSRLNPAIKEKFSNEEDFKSALLNGDFSRFNTTENETDPIPMEDQTGGESE